MYYNADRQDLVRSLIVYGLKCFVLSFELLRLLHERFTQSLDGPFSFNSAIFSLLNPDISPNTIIVGADPGFHLPYGIFGRLESGLKTARGSSA
jgi:hypothetical protein